MGARVKLPAALNGLLRSELEKVIYESTLGIEDDIIARRYIIEKVPQIDIAAEMGYERSTISRRLVSIMEHTAHTATKLGYSNKDGGKNS